MAVQTVSCCVCWPTIQKIPGGNPESVVVPVALSARAELTDDFHLDRAYITLGLPTVATLSEVEVQRARGNLIRRLRDAASALEEGETSVQIRLDDLSTFVEPSTAA